MGKNENNTVDLTGRAGYIVWTPVTVRFSDQDPLGHVNNVAIAAYVETGRTMFIHRYLDRKKYPALNFALVRLEIDYRGEFTYPGAIDVGARLLRVGRKSFSTGYGLFDGERCVATSVSVNVFFDTAKRAAVEPPDDIRAMMEAEIAAGNSVAAR